MANEEILTTVASVIAGFGSAMLAFRIEREAEGQEEGKSAWIPWSDWLLISSILACLLLVILPIICTPAGSEFVLRLARGACSAACILLAGYVIGILAHYRLLFGRKRKGERENPEPAERWMVMLTALVSVVVFLVLMR